MFANRFVHHLIIYLLHFLPHSCQILSPSKTGFIVSAHRLINITLLTLAHKLHTLVPRGVADL